MEVFNGFIRVRVSNIHELVSSKRRRFPLANYFEIVSVLTSPAFLNKSTKGVPAS